MRFFLPLLALGLVVSACDSGTDLPEAFTGPTIEFGSQSQSVDENVGTVSIPITLANGVAGETYEVEVLLAAPRPDPASTASTAQYIDDDGAGDLDNFGTPAGINRVATVMLSGESDEQTVTIDVVQDEDLEDSEVAVFLLQRATNGAQVGDDRQFSLQIGTPSIADSRALPDGDVVTVEGIVTGRFGRYTFLQDASAGIALFAFTDTNVGTPGAISVGDRVQVRGALTEFGSRDTGAGTGLKQIRVANDSPATFTVLSRDNELPEAQTVTIATLLARGEDFESERIRVEGLTVVGTTDIVFEAGGREGNYTVSDGSNEMILRINGPSDSKLGGQEIPQGEFTFVGALGQFGGAYQLTPLMLEDLVIAE